MSVRYPKNYNRVMAIRAVGKEAEDYMVIAVGILSRGSSYSETTEDYKYMSGRGTSEKVLSSQEVGTSFTGHRAVGDPAQDYILDEVLYDLDNREVEFLDYDDGAPTGSPNGYHGSATLQITDPGSGDAASRQNIGFTLNYKGKPERGTVTKESGGKLTFTPKE